MKVTFAGIEIAEGVGLIGTIAADLMPSGERRIQPAPYFRAREVGIFARGQMVHTISLRISPPPCQVPGEAMIELLMFMENLPEFGALLFEQNGAIVEAKQAGLQRYAPLRPSIGVSNALSLTWLCSGLTKIQDAIVDPVDSSTIWLFGNGSSVQWGDGTLLTH